MPKKIAKPPLVQADDATSRLTDRKRQAIVDAAIAEFRAHGYESTSMDRVAARADVSKRTVYNHFPSKEELFAEIMVALFKSATSQVDLAYRRDRPLKDQLNELLRQKLRMLGDTNFLGLARVAIAAAIHSPERAQDMVARMSDKEEAVTVWIRAAVADGRLKKVDPEFAAHQLQGLVKGFAFWPQISLGQPPLSKAMQDKVVASTVEMFLGCYAKDR